MTSRASMISALLLLILALTVAPFASANEDPATRLELELVEKIRGHEFRQPVTHRTLERSELREMLVTMLHRELSIPVEDYLQGLHALGLIERPEGALDALLDLYEAQVLAFYDPREKIYYSIRQTDAPLLLDSAMQRIVQIHELTHALQDQVFGAGARIESLEGDWDAQMAYHAVIEGEATLVMLTELTGQLGLDLDELDLDVLFEGLREAAALQGGLPDDAPAYFVSSLQFPYFAGLRFVTRLWREGGWEAIDRLHAKPPSSTEEVLHPDLYPSSIPAGTPKLDGPAEADAAFLDTRLGEFHWQFLLGEVAGAGWSDDRVWVARDEAGRVTVRVDSLWDTEADAAEFAEAYERFLRSRFDEPRVSVEGLRVHAGYGLAEPGPRDEPARSGAPEPR